MDLNDYLPQKKPFRFVDSVHHLDEKSVITKYKFNNDSCFFKGHFPKNPIVPGVLLVEAIGQGATILALKKTSAKYAYLALVKNLKIIKSVYPGDTIKVEVKLNSENSEFMTFKGEIYLENSNEKIAESSISLFIKY